MGEESGKIERECVCGCVCVCKCVPVCQVCVGVTAGNQAGTDLVSWGCGGSDLISNEYSKGERKANAKHSVSL